jgi:hypothetical protein
VKIEFQLLVINGSLLCTITSDSQYVYLKNDDLLHLPQDVTLLTWHFNAAALLTNWQFLSYWHS